MIDTYLVTITHSFTCAPAVFEDWADELSTAWIEHSGLNPLLGEYRTDDHTYTFRKVVEDADSLWESIQVVYAGVQRALASLAPHPEVQITKTVTIHAEAAGEDTPTQELPSAVGEQDRA